MNLDLLKIYYSGAEFMGRHPQIQSIHHLLGQFIENMPTRKGSSRPKNPRLAGATDDDIRRGSALLFCMAAFFVGLSLIFGAFPFSLMALFLYAFGTFVSTGLKHPYVPKPESEQVKQPITSEASSPETSTLTPKGEKTLFWKIYGYINTLCIWGWVYLSLAQPKALKEWIIQKGIMEYIPHEHKVVNKWGEIELLIGGIVVISIGFAILRLILTLVLFILQKSPERDIREL